MQLRKIVKHGFAAALHDKRGFVLMLLLIAPWWVSAGLAVLAYVGLRWILPAFAGQDKLAQAVIVGLSKLAPFAAFSSEAAARYASR